MDTFVDVIEVIAAIAAAIGTVWAAILARDTSRQAKESIEEARQSRMDDLLPRPKIYETGNNTLLSDSARFCFSVANAGEGHMFDLALINLPNSTVTFQLHAQNEYYYCSVMSADFKAVIDNGGVSLQYSDQYGRVFTSKLVCRENRDSVTGFDGSYTFTKPEKVTE